MQIIRPRLHGVLDYVVAATLIAFPIVFDFGAASTAALVIALGGGIGLAVYSALTDYAAGLRALVPWRAHLALDAVAALALGAAPFAFGFGGLAHRLVDRDVRVRGELAVAAAAMGQGGHVGRGGGRPRGVGVDPARELRFGAPRLALDVEQAILDRELQRACGDRFG